MKIFIMIPTYNERDNIANLIKSIHEYVPEAQILIVDDSSPDGTAKEVLRLKENDPNLHLLLRKHEVRGRGWAGRDGFMMALTMGADVVVEMDGDLSHQPRFIPDMLKPLIAKEADVVIGSRYIQQGKDIDRAFHRRCISNFAKFYLQVVLGLRISDPTSGFRVFSKEVLQKIKVETLQARDPFIVSEVLFLCFQSCVRIKEIPIEFVDRTNGTSKLNLKTLLTYFGKAISLRIRKSIT